MRYPILLELLEQASDSVDSYPTTLEIEYQVATQYY